MSDVRFFLFANGEIADIQAMPSLLEKNDLLVAVDGGLKHLQSLGLEPRWLIGDLDSVNPEDVAALERKGVRILRFPVEKDETDLELALLACIEEGIRCIRVAGALGGRLDHTLANLSLLALPALAGYDVQFEDGRVNIRLITSRMVVQGKVGDILSLLPFSGSVEGIQTDGLQFPLKDETLFPEHSRGVSNVLVAPIVHISIQSGKLLCILNRQEPVSTPVRKIQEV